jgi:hypothetical protein
LFQLYVRNAHTVSKYAAGVISMWANLFTRVWYMYLSKCNMMQFEKEIVIGSQIKIII